MVIVGLTYSNAPLSAIHEPALFNTHLKMNDFKIVLIITLLLVIASCKNQMTGFYAGTTESGIKHLTTSTLYLRKDKTFKLSCSTSSFESTIPSTGISDIEGKYKREKDQIKLLLQTKRGGWLSYGENPDTLNMNPAGARRTALIGTDTIYGPVKPIAKEDSIIFNITIKPNSKYLWNERNCFIKFDNPDVSKDLKNYCSEIRLEK